MSHGTHHTSSSSTRVSLRCDMLKLGGCARSSLVTSFDAFGMDAGRQCPRSRLDPTERGRKHLRKRHACMGSCVRTTRYRGALARLVWCNTFLS